ncbi:unnamed protein product [Meganyctiphanes norvegica]|uniref:Uncharacterized protein n=2 Tax=Meganyctiphanes norvegica TaxID=48144 RepID=A0AAV2SKB6_MEGNR
MDKVMDNIRLFNLTYNPLINTNNLNIVLVDGTHPSQLSYLGIAHKICLHIQREMNIINANDHILRRAPVALLPTPTLSSVQPSPINPPAQPITQTTSEVNIRPSIRPSIIPPSPTPISIVIPPPSEDQLPSTSAQHLPPSLPQIAASSPPSEVKWDLNPKQDLARDQSPQSLPTPSQYWNLRASPEHSSRSTSPTSSNPSSPLSTSSQFSFSFSVPSAHSSPPQTPPPTSNTPSSPTSISSQHPSSPKTPPQNTPSPTSTSPNLSIVFERLTITNSSYRSRGNWRGRRPIHHLNSKLDDTSATNNNMTKRRKRPSPLPSPSSKSQKNTVADRLIAQAGKPE